MAKGLCVLLWIKRLLTKPGFAFTSEMGLLCNNKAVIAISHDPVQYDLTKHVEVVRNFIKENLEAKVIRFPFFKSEDQRENILTKVVSRKEFHHSLNKLCIRDLFAIT